MSFMPKKQTGFTIAELLIVVVVIAILATISIVAYRGIQERARTSALASSLTQAAKKLSLWQVDSLGQYPTSLVDIGITDTDTIVYQYTPDSGASSYCLTATTVGVSYYISNTSGVSQPGVCSGYNLVAWNKTKPETVSIPSATIDTAVYRTSTASMRVGPNSFNYHLRGNPFSGTPGQTYTVTFWLRTDANWNGTAGNSKVRFGNADNGSAWLNGCYYNGVKVAWTQVTCSYTLISGATRVNITVGNDGTVGNIWFDDVSLTLN